MHRIILLLLAAPLAVAAYAQTATAPRSPAQTKASPAPARPQARPPAAATAVPPLAISRQRERQTAAGPAANFTGGVRVEPLFGSRPPSRMGGANVSFAPRARTAWHTHPLGQTLIVTAGRGRVQVAGQKVAFMEVGDVVRIAPGQRHWHGAAPDVGMTHLALQESVNGGNVTWLEKVTDAQYEGR